MRRRQRSSVTSAPFRYEWRPSRWLTGALSGLAALAAVSLLNCDLPPALAWPSAACAFALGLMQARTESRRPGCKLLIPSPPAVPSVDGMPMERVELLERGPLLVLRWRSGRRRRQLLFWPDTLPRARRRELRLAVKAHGVSRQPPGVAP